MAAGLYSSIIDPELGPSIRLLTLEALSASSAAGAIGSASPLPPPSSHKTKAKEKDKVTIQIPPIRCTLSVITLDEAPSYEALSYCWGDATVTAQIECNGLVVQVTQNLHDALVHLRREDEPRILWVDAVCIDQMNLVERQHEVNIMRSIYQKADQVVVWLGKAADNSDMVFAVCERLLAKRGKIFQDDRIELDGGLMYGSRKERVERQIDALQIESSESDSEAEDGGDAEEGPGQEGMISEQDANEKKGLNLETDRDRPGEDTSTKRTDLENQDMAKSNSTSAARDEDDRANRMPREGSKVSSSLDMVTSSHITYEDLADRGQPNAGPSADSAESKTAKKDGKKLKKPGSTGISLIDRWRQKRAFKADDPTKAEIAAFWALLRRPWWNRVWVVQEACVARELTLQCGDTTMDWSTFVIGFVLAVMLGGEGFALQPDQVMYGAVQMVGTRGTRTEPIGENDVLPFLGLLWDYRRFEASDPRDKVYALLGLTLPIEDTPALVPDYEVGLVQCYKNAAMAVMEKMRNLDLLTTPAPPRQPGPPPAPHPLERMEGAQEQENRKRRERQRAREARMPQRQPELHPPVLVPSIPSHPLLPLLPSWAPDWRSHRNVPMPFLWEMSSDGHDSTSPPPEFKAAGSAADVYDPVLKDDGEGNTLVLEGHVADRVLKIGDTMPSAQVDLEILSHGWKSVVGLGDVFVSTGHQIDTFLRWEDMVLPPEMIDYFPDPASFLEEAADSSTPPQQPASSASAPKAAPVPPTGTVASASSSNWDARVPPSTYPTGETPLEAYFSTLCLTNYYAGRGSALYKFHLWRRELYAPRKVSRSLFTRLGWQPHSKRWRGFTGVAAAAYRALHPESWYDNMFFAMAESCVERRFAVTSQGYFALVPADTKVEDEIALFRGGKMPFVVRPREAGKWTLVGAAYVHGIMYGEKWVEEKCEKMEMM